MKVISRKIGLYVAVITCVASAFFSALPGAFAAPPGSICGCTDAPEEMDHAAGSGLDLGCYNNCKYGIGKFKGKGWESRCNTTCKSWSSQNREICCYGGKTKGGMTHNGCCNTVRNLCWSACLTKGAKLADVSANPNFIPEIAIGVIAGGVDPAEAIDAYMATPVLEDATSSTQSTASAE